MLITLFIFILFGGMYACVYNLDRKMEEVFPVPPAHLSDLDDWSAYKIHRLYKSTLDCPSVLSSQKVAYKKCEKIIEVYEAVKVDEELQKLNDKLDKIEGIENEDF